MPFGGQVPRTGCPPVPMHCSSAFSSPTVVATDVASQVPPWSQHTGVEGIGGSTHPPSLQSGQATGRGAPSQNPGTT